MTERTREVFDKHEIRKTKSQKERFRKFAMQYATDEGYAVKVEKHGKAENVVVGSPKTAKVIYTAHYDTPAGTPFPNLVMPKCIPLYILYQIFICVLLYTVPVLMMTLIPRIITSNGGSGYLSLALIFGGYALMLLELYLLIYGPANKHNYNDNTSGVSVVLELMRNMPYDMRDSVAFILFDLEERGTRGSQEYARKNKKWVHKTPVINFDCVGDGSNILLAVGKKAHGLEGMLNDAFTSTDTFSCEVATKGVYYPSDQRNFHMGVGVGAFKKSKRGILYADKIHTKRDLVCSEENIDYLVDAAIKLAEALTLTTKVVNSTPIEAEPLSEQPELRVTEAPLAEEVSEPKVESVSIADEAEPETENVRISNEAEPETEEENIPDNAPEAEAKESEE